MYAGDDSRQSLTATGFLDAFYPCMYMSAASQARIGMTARKEIKKQRRAQRQAAQRAGQRAQARIRRVVYGLAAAAVIGIVVAGAVIVGTRVRSSSGEDANVPTVLLAMGDNFFQPRSVTVKMRQTYRIRLWNQGQAVHNFVMAGPDQRLGSGDDVVSDDVQGGEFGSVKVRVDEPGKYGFVCTYHGGMGGTVVVEPP
ncbi:MAG: cupredoxin domain-containing protein [Chloroflexi bacterium]|nr:cupredoxin domain-containing protein [Chloroflexota bacterium]